MRAARWLRARVVRLVAKKTTELELLHQWLGQELAQKFTEAVAAGTKYLDALIAAYNTDDGLHMTPDQRLHALDMAQLKAHGIEIWDHDSLMSRSAHDVVRAEIEAHVRFTRIK